MSYMKEEMLKDYYIERREDKRRILDKYVYSVFVKEIIEEDKKRFEIKMGIVLGKERGEVVFDVNKKRLNLKNRNNQFYILNDDLVKGYNLIYKNRFIVNVVLDVNWNICGRSKINYNRNKMYISDYQ